MSREHASPDRNEGLGPQEISEKRDWQSLKKQMLASLWSMAMRLERHWLWLLLPIALYLIMMAIFPCWTAEDAYIMLRYARNLANGYWFIYNPGDPPVWGSTSTLTTLALAGFIRLGVAPVLASQLFGFLTGVALLVTLYAIARLILKLPVFPAVVSCLILAGSPLVSLSMMGFDANLFALLMLLLFGLSLLVLRRPTMASTASPILLLSLVAFLLSISRPEGALVALVTLVVVLWSRSGSRRYFLLLAVLPYLVLVAAFYGWATLYFGYPLPNPFYVKAGSAPIYLSSFALLSSFIVLNFVPVLFTGAWLVTTPRKELASRILSIAPALAYASAYLAINQIQNIELRFQFPLLPVLLILFAQAIDHFLPGLPRSLRLPSASALRRYARFAGLGLVVLGAIHPYVRCAMVLPWGEIPDAVQVGVVLHGYAGRGYTMVVTEAGRIPFYADWRTIDAFGLNDPYIAHYGLTDAYLTAIDPELIMFWNLQYGNYTPAWDLDPDPWAALCLRLYRYATVNNYTLGCIFRAQVEIGRQVLDWGYQWYFVRPTFADSAAIINDLRSIPTLDYVYPSP